MIRLRRGTDVQELVSLVQSAVIILFYFFREYFLIYLNLLLVE